MDQETSEALAILRDAVGPGFTLQPVDADAFKEMVRRAALREGWRFHVTHAAVGVPLASSWWADGAAARARYDAHVAALDGRPGARVTLIDEAERETLAAWPEGS